MVRIPRKSRPGIGSAIVVGKGGKQRKVKVRRNAPTPAPIGKIGILPKMPKKLKPSKPMPPRKGKPIGTPLPMPPRKGKPVNRPLRKLGRGMARMVK